MPQVTFSNFFSTLPTTVSFPLKRRDNKSGTLCWFNPDGREDALPHRDEIRRTVWNATDEELFDAFPEEEANRKICELMDGFCPPSPENVYIDGDVLKFALGKSATSGELLYVLQSEFDEVMCAESVPESEFLNRVRSLYLLSKVMSMPLEDPNTLGGESLYPAPEEEIAPWHTKLIRAKDLQDAQKKVADFLVTLPLYRTWAVLMEIFGEELQATVYQHLKEQEGEDAVSYQEQADIGSLASVCPPVQVCLFWRE
jgi:hypothetical protein